MSEPIGIEEARAQLQLGGDTSRDADLARYVRDAREWVETYTGHTLVAGDATETFSAVGRFVTLRAWPIVTGAVMSIAVVEPDGAERIVGAVLDPTRRPATVRPLLGGAMMRPDQQLRVTVRTGYGTPDAVPGNMRRAMLLLIAAYDADREGGDVFAASEARAKSLCSSFRRRRV